DYVMFRCCRVPGLLLFVIFSAGFFNGDASIVAFGSQEQVIKYGLMDGLPAGAEYDFYRVAGRDYNDLCGEIYDLDNGKGSLNVKENRRYAACATKHYNWDVAVDRQGGGIRFKNVGVRVRTSILFPLWDIPKDADPAMAAKWDGFVRALKTHEFGHAAIYGEMAADLKLELERLEANDEDALYRMADEAYKTFLGRVYARDMEYEISTNHGKSQGATF
ncbi:MAG: hypothetical protein A2314_03140, partial [Elusimicrobia bacterium RIFOXYB2_FULL_50_12]